MMDTHYLVNVVHNSFKDPFAIFEPFFNAASDSAPSAQLVNGVNGKH